MKFRLPLVSCPLARADSEGARPYFDMTFTFLPADQWIFRILASENPENPRMLLRFVKIEEASVAK